MNLRIKSRALLAGTAAVAVLCAGSAAADESSSSTTTTTKGPSHVVCSSGQQTATVGSNSVFDFQCGSGLSISPSALEDVFVGSSCSPQAKLESLVPGSALTQKSGAEAQQPTRSDSTTLYTLAVADGPSEDKVLCYKCVSGSATITSTSTTGSSSARETASSDAAGCTMLITVTSNALALASRMTVVGSALLGVAMGFFALA